MLVNSKVISFNILANRFTYYNTDNHRSEPEHLMRFRYKSIISLLWDLNADIYFLQEVDEYFYRYVCHSDFKNYFYISYCTSLPRSKEVNKTEIGLLTMVNKRQYYISYTLNRQINTIQEKENHPLLKIRSQPSSFIGFNDIVVENGEEIGNLKKMSQLLVIEKNHHHLILINCHFEGRPDRQDLRIAQFQKCCSIAQNCITRYNLENRILIGGDFNEPSQTDIENLFIKSVPFNLKLLNQKKEYTSNLKYQKDEKTKTWNLINRKEKLDYLIGNDSFKVSKEVALPKSEIVSFPNWGIHFNNNIFSCLPKVSNWPSDHRLIKFTLEFEIERESTLSINKKSTRTATKRTLKKFSNFRLL